MGGLSSAMKNNNELISVVIPCYNSGATLEQTVASVKAQIWTNLEIIVVDDGSFEPNTRTVLAELKGVTVLSQANSGLPAARNAGFRAACGEYVLPLDADDWLEPTALEVMMQVLKSSGHASFVFCDLQLEGEASGVLQKHYNFFEQLSLNQLPYCLLMPKRLWAEAGGYDESMRQGYEDWEFNIRLGTFGYYGQRVAQPLLHYRVSSSGMLISKSNRLHGLLWSEIQARHEATYRWSVLIRLWREWWGRPSRYPLWLCLVWIGLHRLLPAPAFSWLFRIQRQRSAKRWATGSGA
ncbi:MAG: glycosyltransferase family A protein [Paracoccaceae bacterium]